MVTLPKISGYRSTIINAIIDALTRQRPIPGPGLLATEGPGGTVISLSRSSHHSLTTELPWTPRIYHDGTEWRIELRHCGYVRGPVTRLLGTGGSGTLDYPLPDVAAGDYYVGVQINTDTGNLADEDDESPLLVSQDAADVIWIAPSADSPYFRRLICTATCEITAGIDDDPPAVSWSIKSMWHRLLPELGAYV